MTLQAWCQTDVGLRRDNNQDSFLIDESLGLYLVADGMGGHRGGEVASKLAVETFRDECIDFAARLAKCGVGTEFHLWSGAFHGFDRISPDSALAQTAQATRFQYLKRRLQPPAPVAMEANP